MAADRIAQTITFCQLCEKNDIRWKCVHCSDLFCDDCKKIHERGKATKNHQIVAVKDLNEELLENSVLSLECTFHKLSCTMFCTTCSQCACANCVTSNHMGHTFQDLKALVNKKRQEINTVLSKIDSEYIPQLQTLQRSLPENIRGHQGNVDTIKSEIEKRRRTLKDAVDQVAQHHLSELARFSKDKLDRFTVYQNIIPNQLKELQDKRTDLKKLVRPANVSEVATLVTSSNIYCNINPPDAADFGKAEFEPGKIREIDIQREFGILRIKKLFTVNNDRNAASHEHEINTSLPLNSPLPQDQEIKTLNTSLTAVTSICLGQNETMWVGSADSRRLELIDLRGHDRELPPVMTNVLGFSISSSGDLFVTDIDNGKVRKREPTSGKLTLVKDFKPQLPAAIYVDVQEAPNILYVGLIDSATKLRGDYENVIGQVVKMSTTGEIIPTFEITQNSQGAPLTVPNRIMVNSYSRSLLVINSMTPEQGEIIASSKDDASPHFVYSRSHNHTANPFNPSDIACTKTGKIIICDGSNNLLHVLDHSGRLKHCVDTKSLGIERPWSLALDETNRIYVGTFTYKGGKQTKEAQKGVVYLIEFNI